MVQTHLIHMLCPDLRECGQHHRVLGFRFTFLCESGVLQLPVTSLLFSGLRHKLISYPDWEIILLLEQPDAVLLKADLITLGCHGITEVCLHSIGKCSLLGSQRTDDLAQDLIRQIVGGCIAGLYLQRDLNRAKVDIFLGHIVAVESKATDTQMGSGILILCHGVQRHDLVQIQFKGFAGCGFELVLLIHIPFLAAILLPLVPEEGLCLVKIYGKGILTASQRLVQVRQSLAADHIKDISRLQIIPSELLQLLPQAGFGLLGFSGTLDLPDSILAVLQNTSGAFLCQELVCIPDGSHCDIQNVVDSIQLCRIHLSQRSVANSLKQRIQMTGNALIQFNSGVLFPDLLVCCLQLLHSVGELVALGFVSIALLDQIRNLRRIAGHGDLPVIPGKGCLKGLPSLITIPDFHVN